MPSDKVQAAFNQQINAELYSAYLYLSMSAHFEASNLPGFAHWMRVQNQEETVHAMKLFDFLNSRGGRVALQPIAQPPVEFKSPLDVMEQSLEHERHVTSLINQLYELAGAEKDYPAQVLLQWFINEQVEEEKSADEIVERLRRIGDNGMGLLMMDEHLAGRVNGVANGPTEAV